MMSTELPAGSRRWRRKGCLSLRASTGEPAGGGGQGVSCCLGMLSHTEPLHTLPDLPCSSPPLSQAQA